MSRIGVHDEPGAFRSPDEEFYHRIRACRIHQKTDVGEYMATANIPPKYRRHFQELVLIRSRYPKIFRPGQQQEYMERVCETIEGFQVPNYVRTRLLNLLAHLVLWWETSPPDILMD